MANNRLFLICTTCKPANGSQEILLPHAKEWSVMLAKYYPSTGWYPWDAADKTAIERLEAFLEKHSHGTQWGANIVSELEIAKDEEDIAALKACDDNAKFMRKAIESIAEEL